MKYLGIDYGLSKIGLATSEGFFSRPLKVIPADKWKKLLLQIITDENIDKIIIGVSEGLSKINAENFAKNLNKLVSLPYVLWDETLTSKEALSKMIVANKNKKYRREMEDAFAAALILQSYLDNTS